MKDSQPVRADRATDEKYALIRERYGGGSGLANGYRLHRYFLNERTLLLTLLGEVDGTVLDLACGSGLMGQPLNSDHCNVVGLDFNKTACNDCASNGIAVVRGDAYALPFAAESIQHAFSCQFFNQQDPEQVPQILSELARVLSPGGRLVLVWRNHQAWIHRFAHAVFSLADKLAARPSFPVYSHPLDQVRSAAEQCGFRTLDAMVSFPLTHWRSRQLASLPARAIGASAVLLLERQA